MASLPFLILLSTIIPFASSHFAPTDNLLLNCGGGTATLADGRLFLPDDHLFRSATATDPTSPLGSLYATARVFRKPSDYKLQIKQGGTHLLRLHFRPFRHLYSARFHVLASGSVLLRDLSFDCMDKGGGFPLVKEFIIQVESDELAISFVPVSRFYFAFVNAIEAVSVPGDLLPEVARLVGRGSLRNLGGISKEKFETLFRVNVGGAKVTPFNDTLWRTWVPDEVFLVRENSGTKSVHFSGRIQYQKYGASREIAPDHVYNTARVISSEDGSMVDPKSNMSWVFEVPHDHKYLIRLHFCDIASLALNELYFNVFVNGDMAYENLDISEATGRVLASPYYVDFIAYPDGLGHVVVAIVPSNMSGEFKIHGLLNGLEIMKMNNSAGNLDGDVPAEVVLGIQKETGVGGYSPFTLCALMFSASLAVGFMLVSTWRRASASSSEWSLLPIDTLEGKWSYEIPMTAGKTPYI